MKVNKKLVKGYEDNYYLDPDTMQVINKKTGRPLKVQYNKDGYPEVQLWKNNKRKHKSMHRLFAEAYIPNPDSLPMINHKDEGTIDYSLDNLEWCTQSYNQNYGTANSRRGPKISEANRGKPKPWVAEQKSIAVIAVDPYGNETKYPSAREAARQLGLDQSAITSVIKGRYHKTKGYTFYYA